ncbi:hypothetical protein L9F63_019138, partial [Diploptera punctata]
FRSFFFRMTITHLLSPSVQYDLVLFTVRGYYRLQSDAILVYDIKTDSYESFNPNIKNTKILENNTIKM